MKSLYLMEFIAVDTLHRAKKLRFFRNTSNLIASGVRTDYVSEVPKRIYRIEGIKNIKGSINKTFICIFLYKGRQDISRRHISVLITEFDPINNRKALTPNKYNKITRRTLSLKSLNEIIKFKRELEHTLTPVILGHLKNQTWPLENPQLAKGIKEYIKISYQLISIITSIKFIRSFSINMNKGSKILADNYRVINSKRLEPLIDRSSMKNSFSWLEILKEVELTLESLLTKV